MHLSADRLYEVSIALNYGLAKARWESLPTPQQIRLIAEFEMRRKELLADRRIPEKERLRFSDPNYDLIGPAIDQREARERKAHYSRPEKERIRGAAGTKVAINDLLSQSRHFTDSERAAIDARLSARKLPSLRSLEVGFKRAHVRILKRGIIRNEEEYYLVQEILADQEFAVTEADRMALEAIVQKYTRER
jgi:hypothetical protein